MADITKEDITLALSAIFIVLQLLGPKIGLSNDLTEEEKKGYLARLDAIKALVNESKYPVV